MKCRGEYTLTVEGSSAEIFPPAPDIWGMSARTTACMSVIHEGVYGPGCRPQADSAKANSEALLMT